MCCIFINPIAREKCQLLLFQGQTPKHELLASFPGALKAGHWPGNEANDQGSGIETPEHEINSVRLCFGTGPSPNAKMETTHEGEG